MSQSRRHVNRLDPSIMRTCYMRADLSAPSDPAAGEDELDRDQLQQVAAESTAYLNQWHELISRTNWEKGRVICQWRENVCNLHPEVRAVSDRAWSELTGGVSADHVGRLRRTFERFGDTYKNYDRLSWTHFMVAVAWPDAEMWLEGATQNGWTIEQMRTKRWETMGGLDAERPSDRDIIVKEIAPEELAADATHKPLQQGQYDMITGPIIDGPDWGESEEDSSALNTFGHQAFEKVLKQVPDEFSDAIRNLSELIAACHAESWTRVTRRDALKLLNFLKDQVRNESTPF